MKFLIEREELLKCLQLLSGVVDRRQSTALPILSHLLFCLKNGQLQLVGTDLDLEIKVSLNLTGEEGEITAPARKLIDIVRALPEKAEIMFSVEGEKLNIRSDRSRFNLISLPAKDFPLTQLRFEQNSAAQIRFQLPQSLLKELLNSVAFAMAQQDVRYYLNGLLLEIDEGYLRMVATDSHRLAFSHQKLPIVSAKLQFIIPRKSVFECLRLLTDNPGEAELIINEQQLQLQVDQYTLTSKLIEGRFPNYEAVIPKQSPYNLRVSRDILKQALVRVAALTQDKFHGVCLELKPGWLKVSVTNSEQEKGEDEFEVAYSGPELMIGFNVHYLLDIVQALTAEEIQLSFKDSEGGVRIESVQEGEAENHTLYILMPMRL